MDCTCGVEAVNRRNFYRMVGNERAKITQVYLTTYKSSMMRSQSIFQTTITNMNLKKIIAKNHKTSPSLTEPYQARPLMSKCHCQFALYHNVRMSMYCSFIKSVRLCYFKFSNLIILNRGPFLILILMVHWPKTKLVIKMHFTD